MSTPRPCSPAAASGGDVELRPAELAAFLGVARADVARWRRRGVGPPWYGPPDDVRYRLSDLVAWVETQERSNTGPGALCTGPTATPPRTDAADPQPLPRRKRR